MSKYTVVSICNFKIGNEYKPGVFPSDYNIEAAPKNGVSVLIINDAFSDIHLPDSNRSLRVTLSAREVAWSVVNDFCDSNFLATDDAKPGLFFVEGEYTADEIMKKFPDLIEEARSKHTKWCKNLVSFADDDWANKRQRRNITGGMIHAASFLDLKREWAGIDTSIEKIKCPACFSVVDERAIICMNCKVILDTDKYEELQFAKQ